jgi:hypothetical protein
MDDRLARMRHRYTAQLISTHIPRHSRVLEIGGSREAPYWRALKGNYDVVTVNLQRQESVDYILNVERDSLEKLGEKFRYVTMFEVIEHLENPMTALKNVRNVIERGGAAHRQYA